MFPVFHRRLWNHVFWASNCCQCNASEVGISFRSWLLHIGNQLFTAVQWNSVFHGTEERDVILSRSTTLNHIMQHSLLSTNPFNLTATEHWAKKTSMPIIMSLSLCSCCVFIVSHIWCNCQLMKAKRTAKYCAVLRFSFLLLLAGLHEHGDSASWFIGQLIIVLRKLRVNEWPHLSSHLSFPATSSLLRRLSF